MILDSGKLLYAIKPCQKVSCSSVIYFLRHNLTDYCYLKNLELFVNYLLLLSYPLPHKCI